MGDADRGSPHTTCAGNSLRAEVNDLSSCSDEHHVVLVEEIMIFFWGGGMNPVFLQDSLNLKRKRILWEVYNRVRGTKRCTIIFESSVRDRASLCTLVEVGKINSDLEITCEDGKVAKPLDLLYLTFLCFRDLK